MQENVNKFQELMKDVEPTQLKELVELFAKTKQAEQKVKEVDKPIIATDINVANEQPTSFEELKSFAKGVIVRFPDFAEGQKFVALVKSPSLMQLAASGQIPNPLLALAAQLFVGGIDNKTQANDKSLEGYFKICESVAKAALVSPTYEEIEAAGITLSDRQLMAIFNYTQVGLKSLEAFR